MRFTAPINAARTTRGYLTKTQRYETEKRAWMMRHPQATPQQYEAFIRELIKRLGL